MPGHKALSARFRKPPQSAPTYFLPEGCQPLAIGECNHRKTPPCPPPAGVAAASEFNSSWSDKLSGSGIPPGCGRLSRRSGGVGAPRLDHRLIAPNPPGSRCLEPARETPSAARAAPEPSGFKASHPGAQPAINPRRINMPGHKTLSARFRKPPPSAPQSAPTYFIPEGCQPLAIGERNHRKHLSSRKDESH